MKDILFSGVQGSMPEKTDEAIAREVQQGATHAFGLLVERYEAKMRRYAHRFHHHTEDIEDLVQNVFLKAYTNIQGFDPERRFSPWIYRIAHNEFVNALKKRQRDIVFPFDLDLLFPHPSAPETADGDLNRDSMRAMLDQCLEQLSLKYREVLVLYYFEEMDYKEIADVLRIPMSTVGVRLQRGRLQLKHLIEVVDPSYAV